MTPVDRTGKPDGAMADQLTLSGMRRSRPALHRELVTGTRHADNWEDAVCSSEAEWRLLNASTCEVVLSAFKYITQTAQRRFCNT